MEKAAPIVNSRKLYRLIKRASSEMSSVDEVIKGPDDSLTYSRLECRTEHFKEEFGWPMGTLDPQFMPVNGSVWVDISTPSEVKVTREIGFPKMHETA